jgi:galactose mutarotase-like enzyme
MSPKSSIVLQNGLVQAGIYPLGAELHSLKNIQTSQEYMWQANPEYWNRHAPILFPIVGRLKEHSFVFEDKSYSLVQHGFARESAFEVVHQEEAEATFRLRNDNIHENSYPFNFIFDVTYTLKENKLRQTFRCKNIGSSPMYFSFGGHPAFNCAPIESGSLVFEPELNHDLLRLSEGSIQDKPAEHLHLSRLPLDSNTFNQDALIFENTKNLSITLFHGKDAVLRVDTENMPSLGIWSKPGAPFVCIEPWDGLADFESHHGDIRQKRGIIELLPGKEYENGFSFEIF